MKMDKGIDKLFDSRETEEDKAGSSGQIGSTDRIAGKSAII